MSEIMASKIRNWFLDNLNLIFELFKLNNNIFAFQKKRTSSNVGISSD